MCEYDPQCLSGEEEELLLPPPALSSSRPGDLLPDLWHRVVLFLDHVSLCHLDAVGTPCKQSRELDATTWALLCEAHFPAMSSSIIAQLLGGVEQTQMKTPQTDFQPKGRRGGKRHGDGSGGSGGGRTPWWRNGARGRRRQLLDNSQQVDEISPLPSPSSGPASSPVPSPFLSYELSPGPSPEQSPIPSPGSSPVMSFAYDSSSCVSPVVGSAGSLNPSMVIEVDWRDMFIKRWLKKKQWDSAKRNSGRDRTNSEISEASTISGVMSSNVSCVESSPLQRRVSELTQREIGQLSDAKCRLKICTLCGEKFSPGEARQEPTGCCFHPGDFAPVEARGWTASDLKRLKLYARQALRSAGGASYVQRHPRASRGNGHWIKGLGVLSKDKTKFRQCLEGEVAVTWVCCGAAELFAEGCKQGMHRHF